MTVNYVFFKIYSLGGSNNFICKTVPKKQVRINYFTDLDFY